MQKTIQRVLANYIMHAGRLNLINELQKSLKWSDKNIFILCKGNKILTIFYLISSLKNNLTMYTEREHSF